MTLSLDGVDPCALLTVAQTSQLGVDAGRRGDGTEGGPDCLWGKPGGKPDNVWVARLFLNQNAAYYLGSSTGAQVVQVDGFAAVQSTSPYDDPAHHCILVVDVAPTQSMYVLYNNLAGDYPGINHQVACQLAAKAAESMVANLRKLAG